MELVLCEPFLCLSHFTAFNCIANIEEENQKHVYDDHGDSCENERPADSIPGLHILDKVNHEHDMVADQNENDLIEYFQSAYHSTLKKTTVEVKVACVHHTHSSEELYLQYGL